ncbi:MAG: Response regulator [Acidobacteriota bacterium]|nr:Response regulator [Acidobacteriota bacterium]
MHLKKNLVKYIYILWGIALFPFIVLAEHYNIKIYTVEDGLPQSQVYCLYQARNGYLWIGTLGGGVGKFDGITFTNYTTKDGLVDNQVRTIFEDTENKLWFGTDKGVCVYNGFAFQRPAAGDVLNDSVVRIIRADNAGNTWIGSDTGAWKYDGKTFRHFTRKDGLPDDVITSILADSKGNLWFGTDAGGAARYDGSTFTHFKIPGSPVNDTVYSILEDHKGNLWFGAHGGVCKYDGKSFRDYTGKDGLSRNPVKAILEDRESNLWFATDGGGVCKYDGRVFTYITEKNGLASNVVWSLLEDREGNIWIGTYRGGLNKYSGDAFTYFSSKDGLGDDVIRSIMVDRDGYFWFGTFRGGAGRFDGKTVTNFTKKDGLVDDFVLTTFQDRKGNLWFGTYNGVSKFDGKKFANLTPKDGLSDRVIRVIFEDQAGNIWFGTNKNGIDRFDGKTITNFSTKDGLPDNQVTAIVEDPDREGTFWIGTLNGIGMYDGETFSNISKKCGIKQKNIYSIIPDPRGGLWFAAYGDGILKYKDCSFQIFNSNDGLINDNVVSLCFDNRGKLWIGTEKGICLFETEIYAQTGQKVFKSYGPAEGFSGVECIHNAVCKDDNGNTWFGTIKGAIRCNPFKEKPNTVEPVTHITGLRLLTGGKNLIDYAGGISPENGLPLYLRLPYDKNYLVFDFIGLNFTAPGKVQYRYQLEGFDHFWVPCGEGSYADYPNLPPGNYTFKVKASNSDGVWNKKPVSYSFKITPPFWQTWWFYLISAIAVMGSIYAFIKIRVKHLEKQRAILEEKVRISTLALKEEKEKVERINLELEKRVLERTSELVKTNQALHEEMALKKELEAQLLHAQKMEAIGTIAGGIAHDFNNLLMGILGNVSLILTDEEFSRTYKGELKAIEQCVQNGAGLTRQLLGFARRGKYQAIPMDLNSLIEESAKMFNRTRKEITIYGKYEPHLWAVDADRGQIEQVLLNLLVNAWQAMPDGGNIYLQTENVTLAENVVKPYDLKPGNYVKISITDTGVGMDEATRVRVFEPFFTTKELGRGTGLGLASVYGIITNHAGIIEVHSEKGAGTTFTIYLPASQKEIVMEKKAPETVYLKGREAILLVDDEELVAEVGEKLLKRLGYTVLVARNGADGLEIYKKYIDRIALVILDMIMPGMGGKETFERLKEIDPGVKVLLSSGYSMDGQAAEILKSGCKGFIQKPFAMMELSQKIRSLLDSKNN